jgi:hypothetical protein
MACNLTNGRALPCRESVGGLRNVYFVEYGKLGSVTLSSIDEITDMTGDSTNNLTAFKYSLKGNSSLEQTINASRDTGGVFFDQALTLSLPRLSKEDNHELKLLMYGRPHCFVEDYNNNVYLVGRENGISVSGGAVSSGAAMGDMSGYTLNINAEERQPANFMTVNADSTEDGFPFSEMAGLSGTITIDDGTS